jgi:hypothetical protein
MDAAPPIRKRLRTAASQPAPPLPLGAADVSLTPSFGPGDDGVDDEEDGGVCAIALMRLKSGGVAVGVGIGHVEHGKKAGFDRLHDDGIRIGFVIVADEMEQAM